MKKITMEKILNDYIKGIENCKPQDIIMGKSGSGAVRHNFVIKFSI